MKTRADFSKFTDTDVWEMAHLHVRALNVTGSAKIEADKVRWRLSSLPAWRRWLTPTGWALRAAAREATRIEDAAWARAERLRGISSRAEVEMDRRAKSNFREQCEYFDAQARIAATARNGTNGTAGSAGSSGKAATGAATGATGHTPPPLRLETENQERARLKSDAQPHEPPAAGDAGGDGDVSPQDLLDFLGDLDEAAKPHERDVRHERPRG